MQKIRLAICAIVLLTLIIDVTPADDTAAPGAGGATKSTTAKGGAADIQPHIIKYGLLFIPLFFARMFLFGAAK